MDVYLATAVVSVFFAAMAQYIYTKFALEGQRLPLRHPLLLFKTKWVWFLLTAGLSGVLPFLVSALRYDVGTDYFYTYVPSFELIQDGAPTDMEPAYYLLCRLIQLFGGSFPWLFWWTSLLIIGFFWLGIYQQSEMPWFSVALFFLTEAYFISMNGVRQYVGIAIAFFGAQYVGKQKFWKYALCVAVGALFHYSTLIFLPLYLFSKVRFSPVIGIGIAGVLSAFNGTLSRLLTLVLQQTPYAGYLGTVFHATDRYYPNKILINVIFFAIATCYYFRGDNRAKPKFLFLYYTQLVLLFLLMNRNIVPLADRLCWGLESFHLLLLPSLAASEENRYIKMGLIAVLALLWGQLCWQEIFVNGWHEVLPYQTILLVPPLPAAA